MLNSAVLIKLGISVTLGHWLLTYLRLPILSTQNSFRNRVRWHGCMPDSPVRVGLIVASL
jgi:hypothetical protein